METEKLIQKCFVYMQKLCSEIRDRSVGSEGNRLATDFFAKEISSYGWDTEIEEFEAVDWNDGGASLQADGLNFEVFVSPYSLGCAEKGRLLSVSSIEDLKSTEIRGKIVFLHGEIAKEQLMPKNFFFYNPEEHKQIISLLEKGKPRAVISATGRNPALAGGVYPFPLIEDGDFDIPSVYMTEEEGRKLLPHVGKTVVLKSISKRFPGKGCNVSARKGKNLKERIVFTAHIDAKKNTPGAIDNASGVVVLLVLAKLLKDYNGDKGIEIVALNGEDYYAVPGQMLYIHKNQGRFNEIFLNINIDGAGYIKGDSAFSFYGLSKKIENDIKDILDKFKGLTEGRPWAQGDHSIFIHYGCPAIAVSSLWFTENIDSQDITHTPKDNIEIVDCKKLAKISQVLYLFIRKITNT